MPSAFQETTQNRSHSSTICSVSTSWTTESGLDTSRYPNPHHQLFRDTKLDKQLDQVELVEIGPRFSLQPIKIFKGFMAGEVIYSNQFYVPPIQRKKNLREALAKKYLEKVASKQRKSVGKAYVQPSDELDTVFDQIDKFEKGEIDNLNGEPDADFQMDEE